MPWPMTEGDGKLKYTYSRIYTIWCIHVQTRFLYTSICMHVYKNLNCLQDIPSCTVQSASVRNSFKNGGHNRARSIEK